ncbi:hypothetical protein [Burkholderia sp. Bp9143]|uniref:hypothetical protein n=1 Tax=Burkholderia sp. Bp9143 TaxID=2184574 RepID=UPI000F5ACE16
MYHSGHAGFSGLRAGGETWLSHVRDGGFSHDHSFRLRGARDPVRSDVKLSQSDERIAENWRKTTPLSRCAAAHKSCPRCPPVLAMRVLHRRNRVPPRAACRVARLTGVSYLRKRLS